MVVVGGGGIQPNSIEIVSLPYSIRQDGSIVRSSSRFDLLELPVALALFLAPLCCTDHQVEVRGVLVIACKLILFEISSFIQGCPKYMKMLPRGAVKIGKKGMTFSFPILKASLICQCSNH